MKHTFAFKFCRWIYNIVAKPHIKFYRNSAVRSQQTERGDSSWTSTLQWRHNGHDNVSNHQPHGCLLKRLFRRRSKKTSKLRVTGLCAGNPPVTGEFPTQMASNAENASIWWRHHDKGKSEALDCVSYRGLKLTDQIMKLLELGTIRRHHAYNMMTSSNGTIIRVTCHSCGELTGPRWNPPYKVQWRRALMFSLICARINGWLNNDEAGYLRRHRAYYDVTVMKLLERVQYVCNRKMENIDEIQYSNSNSKRFIETHTYSNHTHYKYDIWCEASMVRSSG